MYKIQTIYFRTGCPTHIRLTVNLRLLEQQAWACFRACVRLLYAGRWSYVERA